MEWYFLIILAIFITKHLIVDFFWQSGYEVANKGTYGHFGGILHTGKHVIVSAFFLMFLVSPLTLFLLCAFEFVVHYHMDWFKMWWGKRKKFTPNDAKFWHWMGIDQYIHYFTYLIMVAIMLL